MVHPRVRDAQARTRQARLIGAVLGGICLFSLGLCIALPGQAVEPAELAVLAGAGVLAVLALLGVMARAPETAAGGLALGAGALAVCGTCGLSGGLASPLALGLVALPLEAWMVSRQRAALLAGLAAAALAGACMLWLGASAGGETVVHPVFWLPVAAWGTALWVRLRQKPQAGWTEEAVLLPLDAGTMLLRFEPGGEIIDTSFSAQQMLGLAPELLLGNGFFERLHVADRVHFLCALSDMRHGAERRRIELRVRLPRAGAASHPVFGCFLLDLFRSGEAAAPFGGILRDNAEVQDLRDALQAARDAEERAAIERTQLLAVLGHELRTPLNAIMGFSGLVCSDALSGAKDPRRKEYAGLIQSCGEHLLAVLDAMLDVGRLRAGARGIEPETFSLREAAETCRSMMAAQAAAKGVALTIDGAPAVDTVCADRRVVQQILINLVSNGVKFTPAGGRVTVGMQAGGGQLRLSVGDTGIGIPCDDLPKAGVAWARFDATEAGRPAGTGLGLALVRELAALHGGSVSIESTRGRGTIVCVTIPDASGGGQIAARRLPLSPIEERVRHGGFRKTA